MLLTYFDEIKPNPPAQEWFLIGGITLPAAEALSIERELDELALNFFGTAVLAKDNEFHGRDIFHGKAGCKGRSVDDRLRLFRALLDVLDRPGISKHVVKIHVPRHRARYRYPMPEYNLGLMFLVELVDDHLERAGTHGMLFGDYERDQADNSIISLSEFRQQGTHFTFGRPIGNLIDTLYFAKSHHSRFIQLADVFMYLVQLEHYHDGQNRLRVELVDDLRSRLHVLRDATVKTWP